MKSSARPAYPGLRQKLALCRSSSIIRGTMSRKRRRIAAIDIGTNSIHMIIVECHGRSCRVIDKEKEMVQLGEGSLDGGPLTEDAIRRGVEALRKMTEIARRWEADHIEAVATSAVREAPNRRRFSNEVARATGLKIRVITGHEEADLIFRAVRSAVDFQGGTALSIDIGGGSVELIVGTEHEIYFATSEPIGVLRLTQKFFREDPVPEEAIAACRKRVKKMLKKPVSSIRSLGFDFCIGTSGTIVTLAELASEGSEDGPAAGLRWLTFSALEELIERLSGMTVVERGETFDLVPKRAATILAGAIVLHAFMKAARIEKIRACAAALREGIVERALEQETGGGAAAGGSVRRSSVLELAARSGADRDHATHVSRLALRIFDQTLPLHELKPADRELIEYAALLHEIGLHVSWQGHHKHTYYLIRHAGLRGFTEDQVALIANVARYHRKAKPSTKQESFSELSRPQREFVQKATAILRMADSLDRGRKQAIRDVAVELGDGKVQFRVRPRLDPSLEIEAAGKRAKYFGRVFERPADVIVQGAE